MSKLKKLSYFLIKTIFSYNNVLFKQDNNRCKRTNFPILVSPKSPRRISNSSLIITVRLQLLYSLSLNSFHKSSHHERTSHIIKEIKANEPKETVIK